MKEGERRRGGGRKKKRGKGKQEQRAEGQEVPEGGEDLLEEVPVEDRPHQLMGRFLPVTWVLVDKVQEEVFQIRLADLRQVSCGAWGARGGGAEESDERNPEF
jgi:hypothetical protein